VKRHEEKVYAAPRRVLLDVNGVARFLGVTRAQVYKMVSRGELRPFRVGTRLRFDPDEIDELLERSREAV
jgi:excisionase family DNA binding protein